MSRCVNTEQGPELIIAVCGEDPETTAPTDAAPRVPWPRSPFLGLGVVGSLSACTAPVDGLIGITLDGSGQPNVVICPVTITLAA